jgi:tetratricopeptide (TPR) repeat protein
LAGLAMAFFDFERGNRGAAAQNFSEYLKNGQKAWPATAAFRPLEEALWLGLLAWKSGRTDEARRYAEDAGGRIALSGEERPDLVKMLAKDLVLLKAEIRLSEGKAAAAVKFLEEELVLSIPVINQIFHRNMIFMNFPSDQDVLARACLQAGNPERAIAEYRKLTTFDPGGRDRRLRNPVYHYRLAKLYEQQGAKDDAKREFVRFLELWKDADEGLPELADAKSCLDRLKGP